jgi:hypothetical protein
MMRMGPAVFKGFEPSLHGYCRHGHHGPCNILTTNLKFDWSWLETGEDMGEQETKADACRTGTLSKGSGIAYCAGFVVMLS